jgi:hypothetical protein
MAIQEIKMKVSTLLNKAKKLADADAVLKLLQNEFGNANPINHLYQANSEAYMEGDSPFVRFELNREISGDYITMIRPEIRAGALTVAVATNHMLDGMGISSQSWETHEGMDDLLEADPEQTTFQLAKQAVELAVMHHRQLIVNVGVPPFIALKTAMKCW